MEQDTDFEGLEDHEIEQWQASSISHVYPRLRGGLFHRTSIQGYLGIREVGHIVANEGQFPYTYPQSVNSLARSRGWVSLFDFGPVRDRDCISIYSTWGSFFFDQEPVTMVLRLNRGALSPMLIPNRSAPRPSDPAYPVSIPYVEAWYPERVPFRAIDEFIVSQDRGFDQEPLFKGFSKEKVEEFDAIVCAIRERWVV